MFVVIRINLGLFLFWNIVFIFYVFLVEIYRNWNIYLVRRKSRIYVNLLRIFFEYKCMVLNFFFINFKFLGKLNEYVGYIIWYIILL